MNLYNSVAVPYFGIAICIITVLPIILRYTIFKPKELIKDKKKLNKKSKVMSYISYVLFFCIMAIFCLDKDIVDLKKANFAFGVMLFFFVLYYELGIRYVSRGRKEIDLYSPFIFIPFPIEICIAFGIIFASIWSTKIYLIIISIIYGIMYLYTTYLKYKINYKEKMGGENGRDRQHKTRRAN